MVAAVALMAAAGSEAAGAGATAAQNREWTAQVLAAERLGEDEDVVFPRQGIEYAPVDNIPRPTAPAHPAREAASQFRARSDSASPASTTATATTETAGTKPNILVFLMDDLGWYDVGYADDAREATQDSTPYITALAKEEGVVLTRHYAHWHCSPSRRSFLSGRWPNHAGGDDLTDFVDDDMDMRFTWVSEKLKSAGYYNLFYGKGHVGVKSIRMLPRHRGFDDHSGFLDGSQTYTGQGLRWLNFEPDATQAFSTSYYGDRMISKIQQELKQKSPRPIFLFSSMQVPHTPLTKPSGSLSRYKNAKGSAKVRNADGKLVEHFSQLQWLMYCADVEIGRVVDLFRAKSAVWDNTLVVFLSDNGGTTNKATGSNYPFRGEKGTSFEGSYRATTFVSGGIIPAHLRGTKNDKLSHIADWYATFCALAGMDAADDPPEGTPMLHPGLTQADVLDPQFPEVKASPGANVYGDSYPGIDSRDLMPAILDPDATGIDGVHDHLVLSAEVFIKGHMKLILAQPCSTGIRSDLETCKVAQMGWIDRNNDFADQTDASLPAAEYPCMDVFDQRDVGKLLGGSFTFKPCLFNVTSDFREEKHIDDQDAINSLWALLNQTQVYQYTIRIPRKKEFGMTPFWCAGPCFIRGFARSFFKTNNRLAMHPVCGVYQKTDTDKRFCA